jgi:hypothetical protein
MILLAAALLLASDWTEPVHVFHDENLCVSYQARLDGPYLLVKATVGQGWHTFTMDNRIRAQEALAKTGKPALGMDQPTRITLTGGWKVAGPWMQSEPKDFSKPQNNWFSWGYEGEAVFAAKVTGSGATKIGIRGQSCSDKNCRNVEVDIELPASAKPSGDGSGAKGLIAVRAK